MNQENAVLLNGDCLEVLKDLPDNSIDSIVTDPPAGISFMGKEWDSDKGGSKEWIAWMTEVMKECLRVLKPGAHALVWAIPRTSHRTASAIEDAGFEVRDVITHLFGSGFPKSLDISKAIDKAAGAERELGAPRLRPDGSFRINTIKSEGTSFAVGSNDKLESMPATPEAKQWQGWGTALKPAAEFWILARKPISEKTVAANVLKHGTGGLNIDASRIGLQSEADKASAKPQGVATNKKPKDGLAKAAGVDSERASFEVNQSSLGRFPANLVLSHSPYCSDDQCDIECVIQMLDAQSGLTGGSPGVRKNNRSENIAMSGANLGHTSVGYDEPKAGASRFFYCAKVSPSERGKDNKHPTVKPQKLMTYLIRMITPPGGVVLDPFMGSGSTGIAALKEGFQFIGIEKEPEYFEISQARIGIKEPETA